MGPMYELIDVAKSIGSSAKLGASAIFSPRTRSISSRAMDGTCVFPMIVDAETIDLDDALIVARAWERTCASFVLTTLTMSPFLRVEDGEIPSAAEYVKKFHVNFTSQAGYGNSYAGLNLESFDKECERLGINYQVLESTALVAAVKIYQGIQSTLAEKQLAMENYVVEDYLDHSILNNLSIAPMPMLEGKRHKNRNNSNSSGGGGNSGGGNGNNGGGNSNRNNGRGRGGGGSGNNPNSGGGRNNGGNNVGSSEGNNNNGGGNNNNNGNGGNNNRNNRNNNNGNNNQSLTFNFKDKDNQGKMNKIFDDRRVFDHRIDMEFKKANDLVPTMLHMRIYPLTDENTSGGEAFDFVLGVKCQLHPVTTTQMVTELARGIKNNDTLFNFIKWTTGETKFFRDFLSAVDQQRADAYQSVRGDNVALIVASKRRKNIAKVWNRFDDNPLTPILSILVSNEDMEILRDEFGYDTEKMPTLINTLMRNFYLLGFMKINNTSEQVDILIDGQQHPQTQLLSTLAKENTKDDKTFKEVMKIVGKRV